MNACQQGNGHGQHGHEQRQDEERLHALHEGAEDEHGEVRRIAGFLLFPAALRTSSAAFSLASRSARANPATLAARCPAPIKSHPLTKAEARRIWLRAQRLDTRAPFGEGPQATAAAVEHLGYVQIDTINVIERCHHHILWTRIPDYRRADLRQAQSVDKSVFEYWTHALSYVPAKDLRFFIPGDEAAPARGPSNGSRRSSRRICAR